MMHYIPSNYSDEEVLREVELSEELFENPLARELYERLLRRLKTGLRFD